MRVLIITWNFPPKRGGMENLLYNIYAHLSQVFTIQLIAPHNSSPGTVDKEIYRPRRGGFVNFIAFSIFKASRLLWEKRADIVFGGSLAILPVLVILKGIFRVKSVVYVHGLDIIYNNFIYQIILKTCLPRMDGIVCNSENTRQLLLQKTEQIKNIVVIPPGVKINANQDSLPQAWSGRYILSVGRLVPRKGLTSFIRHCFRPIAEKYNDVDFIIVGEEPGEAMYHRAGYKQEITDCINENNLQGRIHLLGWVNETRKLSLYQHCECLVFPVIPVDYDVEGFGMVAIEAGIMGRPTVAFAVGGVKDAVDNQAGVLIAPMDYPSMTGEIEKIIEKEKFTDPVIISQAVENRYSWTQLVPEYISFFKSVCSN